MESVSGVGQVGSLCGFLPLALSAGGAVWCGVTACPLLAHALAFAPLDAGVMQRAASRAVRPLHAKVTCVHDVTVCVTPGDYVCHTR